MRYADDFVVMCKNAESAEEAERRVRIILGKLRLELHPEKTRRVDLSWGRGGFDFLGCHLHKRLSGRLKAKGVRKHFLQRWPSKRSMKRVRQRVGEVIGPKRNGIKDVRVLIGELNPILRGWGNYFRTGNAARKFGSVDNHVEQTLVRFLRRRVGRNLKRGQAGEWTSDWFAAQGLHRLQGTIRYPGTAHAAR